MSAAGQNARALRGVTTSDEGRLLVIEPARSSSGLWQSDALESLGRLCEDIASAEDVRVLVLTMGTVGRASPPEGACYSQALLDVVTALAATPHVTIAAASGDCWDDELCLAIACDLRVAMSGATMGFPGIVHGLLPDDATVRRLATLVGRSRLADLLLTGRTITGTLAADWGLVEEVCDANTAATRARALAREILGGAPLAMRYAKEAVDRGFAMRLHDGFALEGDLYAILQTTGDRLEGIEAFRARRPPRYRGK